MLFFRRRLMPQNRVERRSAGRVAIASALSLALMSSVAAGSALVVGAGEAHAENVALPTPLPDNFYAQPANLAAYAPGQIIRVRGHVNPPLFADLRTYQITFRSTDSQGKPIAAVTTVLVPDRHRTNGPLLSFQRHHQRDRAAVRTVAGPVDAGSESDDPRGAQSQCGTPAGLDDRHPDHLGPRSAYGAAKVGGQITLDGIRAVQSFAPARVAHSRVGLAGYSGGGMATAWAAALAPTYAPDLNIAGAAYGGVPMNLIKMAEGLGYNRPHPAFGLAFAAAIGVSREYPQQIPMLHYLSGLGRQMYIGMRNACTNDILRLGAGHDAQQVTIGGRAIFDDPKARRVVEENSLSLYPGDPEDAGLRVAQPDRRADPGVVDRLHPRALLPRRGAGPAAVHPVTRSPQCGGDRPVARFCLSDRPLQRVAGAQQLLRPDTSPAKRTSVPGRRMCDNRHTCGGPHAPPLLLPTRTGDSRSSGPSALCRPLDRWQQLCNDGFAPSGGMR